MADADSLESSDGTAELAALAKSLAEDPKTRKDFLRLLKKKNPNQPIPELDTEDAMRQFADPYIKELDKLKNERAQEKLQGRIHENRRKLKENGYTDDDVTAIEKLMMEKSIPSHDTAAEHFRMSRQLATPTPSTLTNNGVNSLPVDKKQLKEAGGLKNWARSEAHKAVDDVRSGRVKLH